MRPTERSSRLIGAAERVDQTFLELWSEHVRSLQFINEKDGAVLSGRAVIDYYASELPAQSYYDVEPDDEGFNLILKQDLATFSHQLILYESLYEREFETDLGPYFRLLYHSIRHIANSDMPKEEKFKYAKIVRAHLSSSELDLLFFNCHSRWGLGFKAWIEEFQLLKHIKPQTRETNQFMEDAMNPSAFSE